MRKPWPKELFVAIEEADGDVYYIVDTDPKGLSASDEVRPVAKYVLAETGKVINTTNYTPLETY